MKKILVIGETCDDVFVYGECKRFNPEAPTPVFTPISETHNSGLAGNTFNNLRSLFPDFGVKILTHESRITKRRFVDINFNYILFRVDEGDEVKGQLPKVRWEKLCDSEDWDGVVISDYCKGFLSEGLLETIGAYCQNMSIPGFLDTKKILGRWSKKFDFVKINKVEFENNLKAGAKKPWDYCKNLILTLGENGCEYWDHGIKKERIETTKQEVAFVAGAGDTFHAAFAGSYISGVNIEGALRFANKAAAVAVSKKGVVAVKHDEVCDQNLPDPKINSGRTIIEFK